MAARTNASVSCMSDYGSFAIALILLIAFLSAELYLLHSKDSLLFKGPIWVLAEIVFVVHITMGLFAYSKKIYIRNGNVTIRSILKSHTLSVDAFTKGRRVALTAYYSVTVENRSLPILIPYSFFIFVKKKCARNDQE